MATPTVHLGDRFAGRLGPTAISPTQLLVGLLVCTDLLLVVLHLAHRSVQAHSRLPVLKSTAFNIAHDLGLAESFGYVKLFWIVLLLAWLGLLGRRRSYLPWALLFGYLLVDDMFGIHERVGAALVSAVGEDPERLLFGGLRAQDAGELAISGAVGLGLLALLTWGYLRGTARTRATYRKLLLVTLILAVFGLVADGIATGIGVTGGLQLLHLLEDGGELLAVTGILGYVLILVDRAQNDPDRPRSP